MKRTTQEQRPTKDDVLAFLKDMRPELTEDDWKKADVVTVLQWAIPGYPKWQDRKAAEPGA